MSFYIFEKELMELDEALVVAEPSDIPRLLKRIPLEVFGKLLLDISSRYPNIKNFFPSMALANVQNLWTGGEGDYLLGQSLDFVKTLITGYTSITEKKIEDASVLDFGCGWGRIIRLLYKFVPAENIYAVDPWNESIEECKKHGVKCNLALSDWVPRSLPFARRFDLIFAFSVFTHLSEKTARISLETLRRHIADDGLLVITIRPREYWNVHNGGSLAPAMVKMHDEVGLAFTPHDDCLPVEGDITYGDISMSLAYFESHFPQWKIESVECNSVDPYQIILFLKPVI